MVFALTEEQGIIRDMAQNFADEKLNVDEYSFFCSVLRILIFKF